MCCGGSRSGSRSRSGSWAGRAGGGEGARSASGGRGRPGEPGRGWGAGPAGTGSGLPGAASLRPLRPGAERRGAGQEPRLGRGQGDKDGSTGRRSLCSQFAEELRARSTCQGSGEFCPPRAVARLPPTAMRLTFRVMSQSGSLALESGLPGPPLTRTNRICRKSHFVPPQQSIPNPFIWAGGRGVLFPCPLKVLKSIAPIFNM